MTLFDYKGITSEENKYAEGSIEAINEDEAAFKLKEKKIIITSLTISKGQKKTPKDKKLSSGLFSGGKIKQKEIVVFTKKLSTMVKAGLQVLDALKMTNEQVSNKKLKIVIEEILNDLQGGNDLSTCFGKHPKIFDNIYVNMIKAGEASGKLDIFLSKLVLILEKREKIKSQIKSALMYPIILITVAISITTGMLIFVVPTFAKMYGDMGADLPAATQMIINISNFISGYGGLFTLITIISIYLLHSFLIKTRRAYKKSIDKITLKLPLLGTIISQSTIARIALIKANLFSAGVNVLEIIDIAMSSTNNTVFINSLDNVKKRVFSGEDMSTSYQKEVVFPDTFYQLIAVGEKTGNQEEMFISISNYYEDEFDAIVKNMSTMIEPIAIVFIGGVIGLLLVAMYSPMLNMGSAMGGM
tara:strand:- start:545 stop:1789 length:1245 start_codon:yes stop_codon:yes gene_type:complete